MGKKKDSVMIRLQSSGKVVKEFLLVCGKCDDVASFGNDDYLTIGGQRYFTQYPERSCKKCRVKLKTVWQNQDGFARYKKIYSDQNPYSHSRKSKDVNEEPEL